jgi:hypothetical protein
LSLIVRACWLVSFFFTPIYMFILVFVVIFGPKKGVYTTYASFWNFKYYNLNQIIINFFNKNYNNLNFLNFYTIYRFQYTIITCRTTIYLLFSFWLWIIIDSFMNWYLFKSLSKLLLSSILSVWDSISLLILIIVWVDILLLL